MLTCRNGVPSPSTRREIRASTATGAPSRSRSSAGPAQRPCRSASWIAARIRATCSRSGISSSIRRPTSSSFGQPSSSSAAGLQSTTRPAVSRIAMATLSMSSRLPSGGAPRSFAASPGPPGNGRPGRLRRPLWAPGSGRARVGAGWAGRVASGAATVPRRRPDAGWGAVGRAARRSRARAAALPAVPARRSPPPPFPVLDTDGASGSGRDRRRRLGTAHRW